MAKLRVAIVGCGGIANGKHMPSLRKVTECEMVAFCDLIIERAQEAAAKYGADVLLADGVHPTVQGAVLIAREWLKKFEKIEKEIQA